MATGLEPTSRSLAQGAGAEHPDPYELAKRAGAGDAAATARFLRLVAPEMIRVVRGAMGPHTADVDDAIQQALIGLVYALPAFRGECAPAGYACRIALRTALRMRRSVRRRRMHVETWADIDQVPDGAQPPRSLGQRRTELLRRLLGEIPEEQAEALALRTMLGWSIDEIARASGVPANTVRSRLRLAKEALRARICSDPVLVEELAAPP